MNKVPENPSKNRIGDVTPLVIISSVLVMLYITANVMAVKVITIGKLSLFDAGTVTFPFAYMLGDVLAEIWGYKISKRIIILTFICNALFVVFTWIGIFLPYPSYMEEMQIAYSTVFNYVPRIVVASLIAFLFGELSNARVMVLIKEKQRNGKLLFLRTIGSSAVGYIFDTVLFVLVAFAGTVPTRDLLTMIIAQYLAKLIIEAIAGTPLAYAFIGLLKRRYSVE